MASDNTGQILTEEDEEDTREGGGATQGGGEEDREKGGGDSDTENSDEETDQENSDEDLDKEKKASENEVEGAASSGENDNKKDKNTKKAKEKDEDNNEGDAESRAEEDAKKPTRSLLTKLREWNAKGLCQDINLLGVGSLLFIKWADNIRKDLTPPLNTTWGHIYLTEMCEVTREHQEAPTFNFKHITDPTLVGHLRLQQNQAWEVVSKISTKEEENS